MVVVLLVAVMVAAAAVFVDVVVMELVGDGAVAFNGEPLLGEAAGALKMFGLPAMADAGERVAIPDDGDGE